ncbi:NADP-dependent oxidoreductase [Paraburkholderia sp. ZP32-5]|uniref:NADP-dependent oxidoreductase n=1 Tax=Paraburkholderia sp. ZP32-5 TaxID=2883245 RepID=UPI001F26274B|nr:NADP-dependent oxidoreductase [Paraburkholderia sp. ZP32-5]
MTAICRSVVLRSRPQGTAVADNFAVVEHDIPAIAEGEVLTRTLWLSIDPYMRGRMDDAASYAPSVKLGEPMTGETVGEVVASRHADFAAGQIVLGARGWQSHIVSPGTALTALPGGVPYSTYLGVLGMPGATAYAGLRDIGQPQPGETLVVAAASGAVGSVVVQLAKRVGARVVGIAGGAGKCRYVREVLGADVCIDHRSVPDLSAALREACPRGIDVYFENVGGAVQRAVYPLLNDFGRMVMCGMVAEYNDAEPAPGPNLRTTFMKRLRIQGFIVLDRPENASEWRTVATPLIASGDLRYREQIVEGLENAPLALLALLGGGNEAKMVVHVADPS